MDLRGSGAAETRDRFPVSIDFTQSGCLFSIKLDNKLSISVWGQFVTREENQMSRACARIVLVAALLGAPAWAFGQTAAGSIAGVVRDTTGAILPGVTVEASSPALIEKVEGRPDR